MRCSRKPVAGLYAAEFVVGGDGVATFSRVTGLNADALEASLGLLFSGLKDGKPTRWDGMPRAQVMQLTATIE